MYRQLIHFRFVLLSVVMLVLCSSPLPMSAQNNADRASKNEVSMYKDRVINAMGTADCDYLMQMCDTLYNKAAALDDSDNMLQSYLIRTTFLAANMRVDDAYEALNKLKILADKTGKYRPLYDAWSNLVVNYYLQLPDQIGAVAEVKRMQDHAVEHSNDYGLGLVYCALGNCMTYSHQRAIDNYLKAVDYLGRAGEKGMVSYPYSLICQSYGELEDWSKVIEYAKKIKDIEAYPSPTAYFADIMLLRAYTNLDNKDEADRVYNVLRRPVVKNDLSPNTRSILGLVFTEYLSKYGDFDPVPSYISMISEPFDSLTAEMVYNEALGNIDKAYQISKQLQRMQTDEMTEMQDAQIEKANALFNTQIHDIEKAQIASRFQHWLMIIVALVLVLLVVWVWYLKKMGRRISAAKQVIEERNYEISLHEDQLRTSEEMKTCFIESMSHEVRTPLHAIKGFSELLLDKTVNEDDRREFTMLLRRNVDSLTQILEKMIEMSEIVTNTGVLKAEEIDLARLCRMIIDNARRSNPKDVTVNLSVAPDCMLFSNYYYVSALVSNLVENGLKFTDEGSVNVEAKKLDEDNIQLTVTDTGIGMPVEKVEWVFERFTKIDSFKPGLGVGLYLCRIIVERLGGSISIDPEYTSGCRVVVILPSFLSNTPAK